MASSSSYQTLTNNDRELIPSDDIKRLFRDKNTFTTFVRIYYFGIQKGNPFLTTSDIYY